MRRIHAIAIAGGSLVALAVSPAGAACGGLFSWNCPSTEVAQQTATPRSAAPRVAAVIPLPRPRPDKSPSPVLVQTVPVDGTGDTYIVDTAAAEDAPSMPVLPASVANPIDLKADMARPVAPGEPADLQPSQEAQAAFASLGGFGIGNLEDPAALVRLALMLLGAVILGLLAVAVRRFIVGAMAKAAVARALATRDVNALAAEAESDGSSLHTEIMQRLAHRRWASAGTGPGTAPAHEAALRIAAIQEASKRLAAERASRAAEDEAPPLAPETVQPRPLPPLRLPRAPMLSMAR